MSVLLPANKDRRVASSAFDARRGKETPVTPGVFASTHWAMKSHEALGAANDHEAIKSLFPLCYGKPRITFHASETPVAPVMPLRVGCVLSGGQ